MQLTKFTHSCVRLDDGDRSLVLDPGVFSDVDAALEGAGAVLITHEHADHVDADRVRAALARDPRLPLYAPSAVAAQFADLGEQVVTVAPGESFDAAGFAVRTFGGQHAVIHQLVPVIANVAYLIDDTVFHPGDSFTVPPVEVPVLLLPASAPWSKVSEVIDYTIAVRSPRALAIHDALVTPAYAPILHRNLDPIIAPFGITYDPFTEPVTA